MNSFFEFHIHRRSGLSRGDFIFPLSGVKTNSFHIKRKTVISLFLFLIVILALNGCKNRTESNQLVEYKAIQKPEPVQLNLVGHWLGEGKKEQLIKELINEFEFTNPDVKIHMEWPENLYKLRTKDNLEARFNAAVMSSEKPEWDIIRVNNATLAIDNAFGIIDQNWAKKYLVDFSELEEFRKNTRAELLTEQAKNEYHGISPGPYLDGNYWLLWCNTEVAKKVGIGVKQFDMTFEDFLTYVKAVNSYNKEHNSSIVPMYESYDWQTSSGISQMLFFSEVNNYDEIMDSRYSEKKIQAWEKVLRDLERLAACKPFPPDWKNMVWANTTGYPLEDKCLFFLNATWMYNIWLKMDSLKLQQMLPVEIPAYKTAPLCLGGYNVTWAVPKKAPHREQAIRFLLFMNRPDIAEKWARYTKSPTGIKGNLSNANFGFDKFESYQFAIDRKYGTHKTTLLLNSALLFGSENASVDNYSINVLSGEMTAEQAIREIRKKLKK